MIIKFNQKQWNFIHAATKEYIYYINSFKLCVTGVLLFFIAISSQHSLAQPNTYNQQPHSHNFPSQQYIDSIFNAQREANKEKMHKYLADGYLPMGYFNLNLKKLLSYNHYEGFKPGIGIQTSEKTSRAFIADGFYSRSLKSDDNNYGGGITFSINKQQEQTIKISVARDLNETGSFYFLDGINNKSNEKYRFFAIRTIDRVSEIATNFTTKISPYSKAQISYKFAKINPLVNYLFITNTEEISDEFSMHETGFRIKHHPKQSIISNSLNINNKSKIYANVFYGKGESSINFMRVESQFEERIFLSPIITTDIRATAGRIWGTHTPTHLYSAFGTNSTSFGIETSYTFATMTPNEFAADIFSLLAFRTSIKTRTNKHSNFKPVIIISSSGGWADVINNSNHNTNTFNKGYFESGIYFSELFSNNIFKYGFAVHYRYGNYQFKKEIDNWAFKIGIELGI